MTDEHNSGNPRFAKFAKILLNKIERDLFGDASAEITQTSAEVSGAGTITYRNVEEWEKLLRNARRSQITIIVDRAHQGDATKHETPNDGARVDCSWAQADAIHQQWPLRLHRVLSEDVAEFVPITPGEFAAKHLPQPPYDVPPEETFEQWMRGANEH